MHNIVTIFLVIMAVCVSGVNAYMLMVMDDLNGVIKNILIMIIVL